MKLHTIDTRHGIGNFTFVCVLLLSGCGGGGGGATPPPPGGQAPTVTLNATPTSVVRGASVQLSWSSTNATSCTASGGWTGAKTASGTETISGVLSNSTFSLVCSGAGGASLPQSVTALLSGVSSGCEPSASASPECTGVPAAVSLSPLPLNEPTAYRASTTGEVIDGKHIAGNLIIDADNVTIKNSRIDGSVQRATGTQSTIAAKSGLGRSQAAAVAAGPFTILDSVVGLADSCISSYGIKGDNYTALRVHVRGFAGAFGVAGSNVTIRDSLAQICVSADSPARGGIVLVTSEIGPPAENIVADHNTIDLCGAWTADRSQPCELLRFTYPVSFGGQSTDVSVTENLLVGGDIGLALFSALDTWTVTGNRVVDGVETMPSVVLDDSCGEVQWSDNALVTIDTSYNVTSTTGTVACNDEEEPPLPTLTLTVNPAIVSPGGSAQLTWSSTETTSCTASGNWSGAKATSGSQTIDNMQGIAIFSLECTGPRGSQRKSAIVATARTGCATAAPAPAMPACTGVPPGVTLTEILPNQPGRVYRASEGEVIDGKYLNGFLEISARNVIV
jgi:hypothetical protein